MYFIFIVIPFYVIVKYCITYAYLNIKNLWFDFENQFLYNNYGVIRKQTINKYVSQYLTLFKIQNSNWSAFLNFVRCHFEKCKKWKTPFARFVLTFDKSHSKNLFLLFFCFNNIDKSRIQGSKTVWMHFCHILVYLVNLILLSLKLNVHVYFQK